MDWPGLLKWSLNYQDGTKKASKHMMMSNDDKKWLSEALQSYTFDEVKEMEKLIKEMVEKDQASSDYSSYMLDRLEALHNLTYSLDNNKNLCLIGGFDFLFETSFKTKDPKILQKCAILIAECAQNNVWIQNFSLNLHPLRFMNFVLNNEEMKSKEASLSALSSLVRGLNMDIKRKFIDVDGVEFL